ncbi:cation-transporting P-type ATPase [Demequina sp.]|uniref:cation-transporting P-type ATPase n=1 Tax=Demequina sp. TaxID=2050685 RepID=UPI0025C40DC0|nr:cation-transporting P-type ATPase [Demequina sp.]
MGAHSRTIDEVLEQLHVDKGGLTAAEARRRLETEGPNRLPDAKPDSLIKRIAKQFNDILIYVLLAGVVVTALLQHWIDSGVILGVVVINAVIGFIQEGKAEAALEGIRKMLSLDAQVRRDGHWVTIDAKELVPGDVVRLRSGDRVPADLRLIATTNLQIEESALTGESLPAEKSPDPVDEEAGVGDRTSMAFSSSLVTSGRGVGVVTGTGVNTEIGRINTMISEVQTLATPLTKAMNRFGAQLSITIGMFAVAMFAIGLIVHGNPPGDMMIAAISFAVAAIPEGLPAIMTITLAIGVQRMAKRNAITRRLTSVETLGSVTVICSDKTGTLTKNEMTVRAIATADGTYTVSGTGYQPNGQVLLDDSPVALERPDLLALVEAMAVANDAEVDENEDGRWVMIGEPTEGALQTLAVKCGFDRTEYDRVDEVPFESEHKLMATLEQSPDGRSLVLVKGAPDRLLARCRTQYSSRSGASALDHAWWEERIAEMTVHGLRVLAAARLQPDQDQRSLSLDDLDGGLVFLGVVGILDPPRPEAIESIVACRRAGIAVKMITGDHPATALAIALEMNIVSSERGDDAVISGVELEAATDDELQVIAQQYSVFARTSPEHKLRLVKALQATGEVAAMTGDGVNDAPTLKRADVGVAMGIKGTEATKEAAEIVLADDNFASIEQAVHEGRTIYDNLRKAILFILPTSVAEALVIMVAVVVGFDLPLTPTQILWVNMVTAVTLALALGFERAEPGIMDRPPRDSGASILGGYFLWRIAFVSVLTAGATIAVFHVVKGNTADLDIERTVAVNTLVFAEIFYLFNARFLTAASYFPSRLFGNPVAWIAVGVLLVLQVGFVYLPFMQSLFETAALSLRHWVIPIIIGLAIFAVVEVEKAVVRSWQRRHPRPRRACTG